MTVQERKNKLFLHHLVAVGRICFFPPLYLVISKVAYESVGPGKLHLLGKGALQQDVPESNSEDAGSLKTAAGCCFGPFHLGREVGVYWRPQHKERRRVVSNSGQQIMQIFTVGTTLDVDVLEGKPNRHFSWENLMNTVLYIHMVFY